MVTRSTRGAPGSRPSSSFSMRDVVDLPTATDPATPITNGVRRPERPRNWWLSANRAPVRSM